MPAAALNYVLPGGYNTHVSKHEASGNLIIGFSRNPSKFRINQYIQIRKVDAKTGLYLRLNCEEAGRVLHTDLRDTLWADGADRPKSQSLEGFTWLSFRTERHNHDYTLGYEASKGADWNAVAVQRSINAQKAMTKRTQAVISCLTDDNNWETGHSKDVTTISGNTGAWDASTVARGDIQRSLNYAADIITKDTFAVVEESDLRLVMNPVTARAIGQCQEIKDYIKGSPEAYSQITQKAGRWSRYGLPNQLYGYDIVVENAVKNTSRRGASTQTKDYIFPNGVATLISQQGGLVAPEGVDAPTFSTITLVVKEEMNPEEFDDTENRRVRGNIVDDFQAIMTASVSGFMFTGLLT